eukprot:TRINITY_DN31134_c0_g1_i1.p1 TRINITY_DN31134_c0_g1~~TRINITY_DN31134_c0_g1_i1.p1  ORF type:complete len:265 (+),score=25.29 TRINITY_DN31134_c0_g1_i1:299-1093(+)
MEARRYLVFEFMRGCNFEIGCNHTLGRCCKKHEALKGMLQLVVTLKKDPCVRDFLHYDAWQCQSCGTLESSIPRENLCVICRPHGGNGIEADQASHSGKTCATEMESRSKSVPQPETEQARSSRFDEGVVGKPSFDLARVKPAGNSTTRAVLGRKVTSMQTKRAMVEHILRSCNVLQPISRTRCTCCPKHEGLESLLTFLVELQPEACDISFSYHEDWQCGSCGLLGCSQPYSSECRFCTPLQCTGQPSGMRPEEISTTRAVEL